MDYPTAEEFNIPGHYYTSYPSLNHWSEDFGHRQYRESLRDYLDHEKWSKGVHLYLHIPFCAKLCSYCICNIMITNERSKIQNFLDHLLLEIRNLRAFYETEAKTPNIREIHLGGGTPNHLDREQFIQLMDGLATLADFSKLSEFAMEIDPRLLKEGDLQFYASKGVTRISFGVQDFDEKVQQAINRVQPFEMVKSVMGDGHHFKGVNFDLLYGLPFQTLKTVGKTLDQVAELLPERITLLKYCHVPEVRKHMRLISVDDLPPPEELPVMFVTMAEKLMGMGYKWIGLDHFALAGDSLAKGKVVRTFNGFKPGPVIDMLGLGPTATSSFRRIYAQNHYDLNRYYEAVKAREFPIERGYKLTDDDEERRTIIFRLLCEQSLVLKTNVANGFWDEKEAIAKLPSEYFSVECNEFYYTRYKVSDYGRVLLRNICRIFDNKDKKEHMRIAQKTITRRAIESPARQSA